MKFINLIAFTLLLIIIIIILIIFDPSSKKEYVSHDYSIPLMNNDWKIYSSDHIGITFQYPQGVRILENLTDAFGHYMRNPFLYVNFAYVNRRPGWSAKLLTISEKNDDKKCELTSQNAKTEKVGNLVLRYEYEYSHHPIVFENDSGGTTYMGWSGALKRFYYPSSRRCFLFEEEIINANEDVPLSNDIQKMIDEELRDIEKILPSVQIK